MTRSDQHGVGCAPVLVADGAFPAHAARELDEHGFTVVAGPFSAGDLAPLQAAYDDAVASAAPADVARGRTSIRVTDFVNRGPAFDRLYTWPPALDASRLIVRRPFRLSAMQARTLLPGASAQELHVDVPCTSDAWPMLGLILMIDEFRAENGATRFVPGSHRWAHVPESVMDDRRAPYAGEVIATGAAGSAILFNASTWHGHTANVTTSTRRSLQATFIPRDGRPATDFAARMRPETLARLDTVARYVVGIEEIVERC